MYKVVRRLSIEGYVPFEHILSFETMNYIGIYCHTFNQWLLVDCNNCDEFHPELLDNVGSLDELDNLVYQVCNEHIESVSESNAYTFNIKNY